MKFDLPILWESFYSREAYRRVYHHWTGIGLWLFLSLSLVIVLSATLRLHVQVSEWVVESGPRLSAQIPTITITGGIASTPEAREYRITEPESDELLAIIDTTRESAPADLGGALLFLSRKTLTVKKNEIETRSYQVAEFGDYELTAEKAEGYLNLSRTWLAPVSLPFIAVGMLLVRGIQWLFFSTVVLMLRNIFRIPGTYAGALRLTIVAMAPALIVDIIRDLAGAQPPFFGYVFLGMIFVYLTIAVAAQRPPSPDHDVAEG